MLHTIVPLVLSDVSTRITKVNKSAYWIRKLKIVATYSAYSMPSVFGRFWTSKTACHSEHISSQNRGQFNWYKYLEL